VAMGLLYIPFDIYNKLSRSRSHQVPVKVLDFARNTLYLCHSINSMHFFDSRSIAIMFWIITQYHSSLHVNVNSVC
jgi:hypothetical protein